MWKGAVGRREVQVLVREQKTADLAEFRQAVLPEQGVPPVQAVGEQVALLARAAEGKNYNPLSVGVVDLVGRLDYYPDPWAAVFSSIIA